MSEPAADDVVTVQLSFEIDRLTLARVLGSDYDGQRGCGITVESVAEHLVSEHDPALGYVRWSVWSFAGTLAQVDQ